MELNEISKIQTGLMLVRKRATARNTQPKEYKLLTLKSFDSIGKLDASELDIFFSKEMIEERYLTKKGDIILRLTTPYTAISIANEEGVIISSNFAIIRLNDSSFLPEYLALYLNSKKIKDEFSKSAISTTIPLIKVSHLRNVSIPAIPRKMQEKIVDFNQLQQREKLLLDGLLIEKKRFTNFVLNKLLVNN